MDPTPPQPDEPLFTVTPRAVRYLIAIMIVVTGVVCSAAINSSAGGTAGAALAVVGCVAIMAMVLRDLGLTEAGEDEPAGPAPDE